MKKNTTILKMLDSKPTDNKNEKFAKMGIGSVIKQFYKLIKNGQTELDSVIFIKNRNPIAHNTHTGYISSAIGSEELKRALKKKEVLYSDFDKWRNISKDDLYLEDFIPMNWKEPFNFETEKSALVIPVRTDKHYWGNLVCLAEGDIIWTEESKNIAQMFMQMLNDMLLYFFNQEREHFFMSNIKQQLKNKTEIIESLQKAIDAKNDVIEKLKGEEQCAEFFWDADADKYDEVWITVHGYKNGSPEPTVSKWERISDQETLCKVNDLFFRERAERKAI